MEVLYLIYKELSSYISRLYLYVSLWGEFYVRITSHKNSGLSLTNFVYSIMFLIM